MDTFGESGTLEKNLRTHVPNDVVRDRRRRDRRGHIESVDMGDVVVAIIPAYNEERFIASVVLEARRYATHVVVVDDGSSDRTARLAWKAGAFVVQQSENQGKAAALNAGFKAALQYRPKAFVCLDADAQHDPAEIPDVAKPILDDKADVVVGSRFLDKKSTIPVWRQFGQHTLTTVTNATSGVKTTDSQSGFRAFSHKAVNALTFHSHGLSVESEMQFLIEKAGLSIVEIPISVSYLDGNKRNPVVHGVQVLDALLSLVARRRPLLFFALPGFILGCIGLVIGTYVTFTMQKSGFLPVGSSILTATFLISGLLLGVAGVMLHSIDHLVTRISEEIRGSHAEVQRTARDSVNP